MGASMASQNHTNELTVYKGHGLRVGVWQGKLTGRIHYLGQTLFSLDGSDEQHLLSELKEAVDRGLPGEEEALAKLKEKHARFMGGGPLPSGSVEPIHRDPMTPHCWKCKKPFDGSLEYGHTTCDWIICTSCGACGCGSGFTGKEPSSRSRVTSRGGEGEGTEQSREQRTPGDKRASLLIWLAVAGAAATAILVVRYLEGVG